MWNTLEAVSGYNLIKCSITRLLLPPSVLKEFSAAFPAPTPTASELYPAVSFNSTRNMDNTGPDPADSNRILVRKIIQLNENSYGYEETRITRQGEGKLPTVHSQVTKLSLFNLHEHVGKQEMTIRKMHRAIPHVVGFSLYFRKTGFGPNHLSITENTLWKASQESWAEWW